MPETFNAIGVFEAKTRFSELVTRVAETGAEFVITKHERPVASLIPVGKPYSQDRATEAVANWRRHRKRRRLQGLKIKDLIDEGRR